MELASPIHPNHKRPLKLMEESAAKESQIMSVSEAQARRAVRRADLEWAPEVQDPRAEKGQKYAHHGMLSLLVAAFAGGQTRLRHVEHFSEDLGAGARRRLDVPRRISDTALYELLERQTPAGFRESLRGQVRSLIEAKVVKADLFPIGVASLDGKLCWKTTSRTVEGAKVSVDEKTGTVTSSLSALRAVLTSSKARPCLDLELIQEKSGEAPAFRTLFPRVCQSFGGQFQVVTADAGITCREDARVVLGQGKHYLFAVKGNQRHLHTLAQDAFACMPGPARAHTADRRNGALIFRELHVVHVAGFPSEVNFPGAVELWRVHQVSTPDDGSAGTTETRFFVSSMPPDLLTPTQKLELVRLHWGIENGHNWTLDVALEEDDIRPCQSSRDSIEVVTWLRTLAYNLLATWRTGAPPKDRRMLSWARAMQTLRDAFVLAKLERALATRS